MNERVGAFDLTVAPDLPKLVRRLVIGTILGGPVERTVARWLIRRWRGQYLTPGDLDRLRQHPPLDALAWQTQHTRLRLYRTASWRAGWFNSVLDPRDLAAAEWRLLTTALAVADAAETAPDPVAVAGLAVQVSRLNAVLTEARRLDGGLQPAVVLEPGEVPPLVDDHYAEAADAARAISDYALGALPGPKD